MKTFILAAGEGKRLYPLTKDKPKCLLEYQGKAILDYQLETMKACGLKEIVIIKGCMAEKIQRPGTLEVLNPDYKTTNMVYTLFCAEKYFDDDIIVSYGDIIYDRSILEALLRDEHDFAVTVSLNWRQLWEQRMENPLADAETMKISAAGNITELGKKPKSYDEIEGQYMGLFKIKKGMLQIVRKIYHGLDSAALYDGKDLKNMYMTSFIQVIIDRGFPVTAVKVTGNWLEIDQAADLNVACALS